MTSPEGEPTHSIIFRNGKNGISKQQFGGVTKDNYFDPVDQIYIAVEALNEAKQPTEEMATGNSRP